MTRQLTFELPVRAALGRGDYFVSEANQSALAALENWASWPQGRMALVGPAGAGKTHLAHVWADLSGARVVPAPEILIRDPLATAAEGPLAVEDAEALAGDASFERGLFHLCNAVTQQGQAILITGREPPARWKTELPDLVSRLSSFAVTRLGPPDDALLAAVLQKQFADRQVAVPENLVPFLVTHMERSFDFARYLVEELDTRALSAGKAITRALAIDVLGDLRDKANGD
ncbi:MAG: DnaA/Hda family protein [Pseudomonadota bacterium]